MNLLEILQKLQAAKEPVLLRDGDGEWRAAELLERLSAPRLRTEAYLQPGLYIAEISPGGYLWRVLFRLHRPDSTGESTPAGAGISRAEP